MQMRLVGCIVIAFRQTSPTAHTLSDCGLAELRARYGPCGVPWPSEQGCASATSLTAVGCCAGTHQAAALTMASRKVLLGLASGRRLRSRTQRLFWAADLPLAPTSLSLAAAAATALPSGGSPAALLFSSRTISSTSLSTRPAAGDAPGPSAVDHKFVSRPHRPSTLLFHLFMHSRVVWKAFK